jgi:hypothetical protein
MGWTREFQDSYFEDETACFRGALQLKHIMTRKPASRILAVRRVVERSRRNGPSASSGLAITSIFSSAGSRTWSHEIASRRVGVDGRSVAGDSLCLMLIRNSRFVALTLPIFSLLMLAAQ